MMTRTTMLALALCGSLLTATSAGADGPRSHAALDRITTVGNVDPFPALERAGKRDVRRAQRLKRASRRTAHAFDTLAKARALGYVTRRPRRPGFVHARKHDTVFWGRVFDAAAPQALMYWCVRRGRCTLTAYMYRAPAGRPPSTWRRLLQWHRHHRNSTWMTHVWLVPHTRDAFATCAPWAALTRTFGIEQRPYNTHMSDEPCPQRGRHEGH
jgi:hypothetical protein